MKAPAFLSLKPEPPKYSPISTNHQEALGSALGLEGSIEKVINQTNWPLGFYRVQSQGLFIKVMLLSQFETENFAHQLESELISAKIPAQLGLIREFFISEKPYLAVIYPYFKVSFFNGDVVQIRSLGWILKQIHRVMHSSNLSVSTKTLWQERLLVWQKIMQSPDHPSIPIEAQNLIVRYKDTFKKTLQQPAQMIHGDLNFGNVIFMDENALVIDYENSYNTYLPVAVDLAMVIERFCLTAKSLVVAEQLMINFLSAYQIKRFDLADYLISTSYRSLLILCQVCEAGHKPVASEWQKFIKSIKQAEDLRGWLNQVLRNDVWLD
ncbi:MAG: phosphotransferase [Methyloprofundus sp.]|nr:phosphotransferase [Methyloprofundus sp.]